MMHSTDNPVEIAKDLLIADLEHFGESLLRNEEVGEKRFSFFITLVTAVIAGLITLITSNPAPDSEMLETITGTVLVSLLVLSVLSYLRMIRRNIVATEYQNTLRYIREQYKSLCPEEFASYEVPKTRKTFWARFIRGGYAETVGAINSMLLVGFLTYDGKLKLGTAVTIGVILFILQWVIAYGIREGGNQ